MKYLLLLPLALQAQQPCPYFSQYLSRGDKEMQKGSKANFEAAINAYNNAMTHCPARAAEAWQKVLVVFREIDKLRKEAEEAKRRATQERKRAEEALARVEAEKKEKALALDKAERLIDAFYFYNGKFALAYKEKKFYFMDKQGNPIQKLHRWDDARQFQPETGFAIVKEIQDASGFSLSYLLDTCGYIYRYTNNFNDSTPDITAINAYDMPLNSFPLTISDPQRIKIIIFSKQDRLPRYYSSGYGIPHGDNPCPPYCITENDTILLRNRMQSIPPQIIRFTQLHTLLIGNHAIRQMPPEIGQLQQLARLDLSYNLLISLPPQIAQLKNLRELILTGNPIPNEEKNRIKTWLPACNIIF